METKWTWGRLLPDYLINYNIIPEATDPEDSSWISGVLISEKFKEL
jgi:hypothetical protein